MSNNNNSNKKTTMARELVSVIRKGKFDEFLDLLKSKPNVDLNIFINGNTALHYCLLFGMYDHPCLEMPHNFSIFHNEQNHEGSKNLRNQVIRTDSQFYNPSTTGRDISWCKQLILNGANPNLSNQDGWHPIHLAAYCGHPDILTFLLKCNSFTKS